MNPKRRELDEKMLPQFRTIYFGLEKMRQKDPEGYTLAVAALARQLRKSLVSQGCAVSIGETEGMTKWLLKELEKKYGHEKTKPVLNVDALLN